MTEWKHTPITAFLFNMKTPIENRAAWNDSREPYSVDFKSYREAILALMALLDNAVAKERYLAMIEGKTERETCDEEQLDSPEMASARAVLKKMGAIK